MGSPNIRKHLGKHFSEASRLLWCAVTERGWSQRRLGRELGAHEGEIMYLLYGDKRPRADIIIAAERVLSIAATTWNEPTSVDFVTPAARAKRSRKAA
jgi:transcriptional regulator with XRE-family HTH domain